MRVGPVPHKFWIFSVFNIYLRKKYPTPEKNWISMLIRVQFFGSFFLFQYLITGYLTAWTFIPDDWEVIRKITKVMLVNMEHIWNALTSFLWNTWYRLRVKFMIRFNMILLIMQISFFNSIANTIYKISLEWFMNARAHVDNLSYAGR